MLVSFNVCVWSSGQRVWSVGNVLISRLSLIDFHKRQWRCQNTLSCLHNGLFVASIPVDLLPPVVFSPVCPSVCLVYSCVHTVPLHLTTPHSPQLVMSTTLWNTRSTGLALLILHVGLQVLAN